ncbi:MAG: hypothetical protein ABSG56_25320 [Bryobacteraceae bacterium]|jgi:hypothetical protein
MPRFRGIVFLLALPCLAATPRACVGSQSLATFKLAVTPAKGGVALPLSEVNALHQGQSLLYEPVHIPPAERDKAEIAVLLAPPANSQAPLEALKPAPAAKSTAWVLPRDASIVALVYGPQGLSMRKVKSLMQKNDEVLSQLADYADQTAQVSALIQELQQSESSGAPVSAALAGFSAKSGVSMPQIDTHSATGQQAATLLHTLLPSMSAMDPLTASNSAVVQQSAGLATAVAGLFFGNGVGLAAGGVALFQNMHTMLFPETEFQSSLVQPAETALSGSVALCAKSQTAKAHTRIAYLWAHRLPGLKEPKLTLATPAHLPIGAKSVVAVHADEGSKAIARLRDWQLAPVNGGASLRVPATVEKDGEIQLDLSKTKAAPGEYRLKASWDWDSVPVAGDVYLHPYGDLKLAKLAADSRDRLVEGSGAVPLKLEGVDFEFVEKAELEQTGPHAGAPVKMSFTLPHGKRGGDQESAGAELDTNGLKPGAYRLLLAQSDGVSHPIPVTVWPPNPKLEDLPLRPNLDETGQKLLLRGSGLERIEKLSTEAGAIDLAPPSHPADTREATIKLGSKACKDERFDLRMKVQGIEAALTVTDAIEIRGPRPRIASVRKSYPQNFGLTLNDDEIPAAVTASFALAVAHAGQAPAVDVTCTDPGSLRQRLRLAAGDRTGGARLDLAGEGVLFLSLDPGTVGRSGCRLEARVTSPEGTSDAYPLGRVLRVPRIEQFVLTDQKLGDAVYAGTLQGEDLDTIEKTGWDAQHGLPVESIPDTIAGEPQKQSLKIELPWPAPAPHAPVFVWLRGESQGRATGVKY